MTKAPSTARLHPAAPGADSGYQARLANIDATTSTADNILTVISDPRKAIAIVVLLLGLVLVWFLLRSKIKSALGSVWDALSKPFRDAANEDKSEEYVELATGQKPAAESHRISPEDALTAADAIYGCISIWGDDEEGIRSVLRRYVYSSYDWEYIVRQYGTRRFSKYVGVWVATFEKGLEQTLTDNCSHDELESYRKILIARGVDAACIHF